MSAGPIDRRLRDGAEQGTGPAGATVLRARQIIRAIDAPRPLDPQADARVLAGLRADSGAMAVVRLPLRPRRWLVLALTVLGNLGTGLAAAAALRWGRAPAPPDFIVAEAPAALVEPAPTRAAAAAPATVTLTPSPVHAPPHRRAPAGPPFKPDFLRARLAIDPKAERHRPEIPPDFARAHAGEVFSWRVKICVSPHGDVSSATVLDEVHPVLDRQVGRAIGTWKYFPAQQGRRPVHTCTVLAYRLELEPPGWIESESEDGAD